MNPERRDLPPQHYKYIEHQSSLSMPWHIFDTFTGKLPGHIDIRKFESTDTKHYLNGRRIITEAAREVSKNIPPGSPKKALILGSGFCQDIPLEELTSSFDTVTMVDIFPWRTRRAVENLTPAQQAKITIVRADITGKSAAILKGLETSQPEGRSELPKFLRGTQATFTQAQKDTPVDLGVGYDFVSSHLVMSQLDMTWFQYMVGLLKMAQVSPSDPFDFYKAEAYKKAIATSRGVKREHIALLHRAVSTTGLVHFADSTYGSNQEFIHLAKPFFTVEQTDQWKWPNLEGRVWDVQAFSLHPKPQKA